MQPLATRNAPDTRLPLRFLAAGVAGYLILQAMLFLHADRVFSGAYTEPAVVAIVHLATLAWGTMVMLGAYHQLAPVLLQVDLHSERLGRAAFALHLTGTGLLVVGFYAWYLPAVLLGGGLAALGLGLALYNLARTLWRARPWNLQGRAMAVALAFLLHTVVMGLALALNFHFHFIRRSFQGHLAEHFVGGLAGWFTLTIVAVGYRLIPMFTLAHGYPQRWQGPVVGLVAWGALLATPAGAAVTALGLPRGALLAAALPLLAGLVLFVLDVLRIVAHRRRRRLELVTRFSLAACAALLIGAGAAAALILRPEAFPVPAPVAATAAMYLFLMGWISLMIVGQLYKIIPFLTWLHRYAGRAGREAVPLVSDLYSAAVGEWSFRLLTIGTFGTALGVLSGRPLLAQGAQAAALAGALLFGWAMAQVLLGRRQIPRRRSGAEEG